LLPPRVKASRPVTLKWWHWHGWHANTHKKIVDEYQKLYDPNLNLDSTAFPDYLQAVQATRTAVVGGAGPDIICPPPLADLVGYVKSNYLALLSG
jgi:ABC-type glycerol-3-phosphate transport system substrate-binding protein